MLPDMPEPHVDPEPPRAPGGADATMNEADPGSTVSAEIAPEPMIPEPPFSAQQDEAKVPDEIQEGEEPDDVPSDVEEAKEESTSEEPPA
jgi:hypothetical protein